MSSQFTMIPAALAKAGIKVIDEKEGRINVTNEGLIVAKPDIQVPFKLFISFEREYLSKFLKSDIAGLWSFGLPSLLTHQVSPLLLHDAVFSFRVFSAVPSGFKHPIGSGRGFLIFESAEEVAVH